MGGAIKKEWAAAGFCFFLYLLIQIFYPGWVEKLYLQENFDWLNWLARSQSNRSLDYYLGKTNEHFFGPISQIISGLGLMIIVQRYACHWKSTAFALTIFVFLLFTKWEVLLYPPYGDAIGGPFAEGLWLAKHGFNYLELFHQPGYAEGGPRVYLYSIYPTYLAVLFKLLPYTKLFLVVNHLIVFVISAVIVTLMRNIVAQQFSKPLAGLVALFLLFMPTYQAQTEAINMELPCLLFVMLSAYYLILRDLNRSGWMALAAVLVKGTGVFACAAFLIVGIVGFLVRGEFYRRTAVLVWSGALMIFAVLQVVVKFLLKDQHADKGMISLFKGWPSFEYLRFTNYFFICLIIFIVYSAYYFLRKIKADSQRTINAKNIFNAYVMFAFGLMWFMLFLNFYAVSPRYSVLFIPFMVFMAFYTVVLFIKPEKVRQGILWLVLPVILYSSYGCFFNPTGENDHVQLERSLEYRNDLKLNQKLANLIESNYADVAVGAPFTIAQLLAIPEYGYVNKRLNIIIYGFPCRYEGLRNFSGVDGDDHPDVFIGIATITPLQDFPYPINPNDHILEDVEYGQRWAKVFTGGISIETMWRLQVLHFMQLRGQKI